MNYRIRKAAVSLLAAGLTLGWAAMPVLGSAEAIVEDISDDAEGHADAIDKDEVSVENKNAGAVESFELSLGDTGGNSILDSEDENTISTGGAGAGALSDNFLNSNFTSVSGEGESAHATVRRITDDALGTAFADDSDLLSVFNLNCWSWWHGPLHPIWECGIGSKTLGLAFTGDNLIDGADDGNSISTGPAEAGALSLNVMNTNETEVTGWGHSAFATVEDVSDDAAGHADAIDKDELSVENKNFGFIDSLTKAKADTGGNSILDSEDGNTISTGGAGASAGSANFLNTNETSATGEGETAEATVSGVSDDALGTAFADDSDTASVENTNKGFVESNTKAKAETGDNLIDGADDGNSISTGDASAESTSSNTVNTNVTTISM